MLSLSDEWKYSIAGLCSICIENESAIKSALNELKNNGYLIVNKKMPNETESGRIEYEYYIFETPKQAIKKQGPEKQGVENLGVEFLGVENQGQYNTNNINTNNKILNNKETNNNTKEIEEIYNFWNTCNIINHTKITEDIKRVLKTRLDEYDVEQLKGCISHYKEAYHSEYEYCKYKWNLLTFFKQKNAYLEFMEDGSKWNNYLRWKNENNISYTFDTTNEQQRELQYYTNLKNTDKAKYDEEMYQLKYWKPELYDYIYNQLENGGFEEL